LGLETLLRIKPRARRSSLTKERPSGDASGSLSQRTRIVYASGSGGGSGQLAAEVADVLARQADRCLLLGGTGLHRSTRTAELARTGMVVDTRIADCCR